MFTKARQKRANYTVKNVETIAAGKDVQARLFTLAPGEIIPWHSHSEIADHFFVLDGELTVETRAPDDCRALGIGEHYQISAGHTHQTSNRGTSDCRFLIVQGVGRYDFLRSPRDDSSGSDSALNAAPTTEGR
jgi:mannose-6-phosphate isomerase-like protein (cupin superfamily)